jgi:hypothetical protein
MAEDESLAVERRMAIFRAVVEAQDGKATVAQSRQAVAARFGVTERQVRAIEREGLHRQWPPL